MIPIFLKSMVKSYRKLGRFMIVIYNLQFWKTSYNLLVGYEFHCWPAIIFLHTLGCKYGRAGKFITWNSGKQVVMPAVFFAYLSLLSELKYYFFTFLPWQQLMVKSFTCHCWVLSRPFRTLASTLNPNKSKHLFYFLPLFTGMDILDEWIFFVHDHRCLWGPNFN